MYLTCLLCFFLLIDDFLCVQGVPVTSLRFLFDGRRINDDETPKQVCCVYEVVSFVKLYVTNQFL